MHIIGIVAEYNPFHRGHEHHIKKIKKIYPDALILVTMSGSFVQRGEPALFHKSTRARWALANGAHAVIELPTIYATANAERFAAGAVRLLAALGATTLSFGAETADAPLLWKLATLSRSEQVQDHCKTLLKKGHSYGSALREAIQAATLQTETSPSPSIEYTSLLAIKNYETILTGANNILALEYIKSIQTYNLPLKILPIVRSSDHHATELTQHLPSGTALRQAINHIATTTAIPDSIIESFPTSTRTLVTDELQNQNFVNYETYSYLVHYQSRLQSNKSLRTFPDFTEGLDDCWTKASEASTWAKALGQIKSKRYTYSRLQRMGAYTVLNITKALQDAAHEQGPMYARLLGFTDEARPWLKERALILDNQADSTAIPIIQKWAPFVQEMTSPLTAQLLELDMRATDIQALCMNSDGQRQGHQDYYMSPIYVKHQ